MNEDKSFKTFYRVFRLKIVKSKITKEVVLRFLATTVELNLCTFDPMKCV